jgi:hypothetical protein
MEVTEEKLAAAAVAPRVTKEEVDAAIREGKVTYTVLPNGRTTVCCIEIFGGRFSVTGESSCVSKENFNAAMGESIALKEAQEKIWPVLGAVLAHKLHLADQNPVPSPGSWLDRVKQKLLDRSDEYQRLMAFIGTPAFEKLDDADRRYLVKQRDCMEELVWILTKRIQKAEGIRG